MLRGGLGSDGTYFLGSAGTHNAVCVKCMRASIMAMNEDPFPWTAAV